MRVLWGGIVVLFAAMAVATPLIIVREHSGGVEGGGPSVRMAGTVFSPRELVVRKGTEVIFDNDDVAPHTVTADSGEPNSGVIGPGKAFRLVVQEPFAFHCEIHPSMKAKLVLSG